MDIKNVLLTLAGTRRSLVKVLSKFSIEQMNEIPEGFKNNLIWNFGHVIVTQQSLMYSLSGKPSLVPVELMKKYRGRTFPDGLATMEEFETLKALSKTTLEQLEIDYNNGVFDTFQPMDGSKGLRLDSIEHAILFDVMHEGLHLGTCYAIRKFLKSE